jgi:hypothetical protein
MALLAGQGEARPERILRRFFSIFVQVWAQSHELNKRFLPRNKQIRILGSVNDAAYQEIEDRQAISGRFDFEFAANAINMSKQAMQQSLSEYGQAVFSPIALQSGIADPGGLYRFLADYGKALGVDPRRYINEPAPGVGQQPITADEAIAVILGGRMPVGAPAEPGGAMGHLMALEQFANADELMGQLSAEQADLFASYFRNIMALAQQQAQQQAALAEAAGQQQAGGQGQPGRPAEQPPDVGSDAMVSGGAELRDETLPGAGGGASQ